MGAQCAEYFPVGEGEIKINIWAGRPDQRRQHCPAPLDRVPRSAIPTAFGDGTVVAGGNGTRRGID